MPAKTWLLFAPHPDDEILGAGGLIAQQIALGTRIVVVIISDGKLGLPSYENPLVREEESLNALQILGIKEVEYWRYPDGGVPLSGQIVQRYRQIVKIVQPDHILLPHPQENHQDHQRVTRGILNALLYQWQGELWFYETVHPLTVSNQLIDISSYLTVKLQALNCHQSQLKQFDYISYSKSLASLRGVSLNTTAAEAFLVHAWDGRPQHFFETLPLISVIIRSNSFEYLQIALQSLLEQQYQHFEVLLVWFGEQPIPLLENFAQLNIYLLQGKPSRSYNLNLALQHANGEYIAILDHDDIFYPEHLVGLLTEIYGQPNVDIVYSGYHLVQCTISNQITILETVNQTWDMQRVLIGNMLPIHTLLCRATIFHSHSFDESLEVYEDWDWLIRIYLANYRFLKVDQISCEYRIYSESKTLLEDHTKKDYTVYRKNIIERILSKMTFSNFEKLAELVQILEQKHAQAQNQIKQLINEKITFQKQLEEYQALNDLIVQACQAVNISQVGRNAITELISLTLPCNTLFSIVLPVYNTSADILRQTLFSIRQQAFKYWELCLVDDASNLPETLEVINLLQQDDFFNSRLRYKTQIKRKGIVKTTNEAIQLATAPYVVFVDHDDLLHPEALLHIALDIEKNGHCTLLYTDSRKIDHAGEWMSTNHKPQWSPESLLGHNYVNHLTIVNRTVLNQLQGLRVEYEGSQDWDLLLRLEELSLPEHEFRHIAIPLYDWRATLTSVAYANSVKPWAFEVAKNALEQHLINKKLQQIQITPNPHGAGYLCYWNVPPILIEIIIPTHSNIYGLRLCLQGLLEKTNYPALQITIVANRCTNLMQEFLQTLTDPRIKIIEYNKPFNWAAQNNFAVTKQIHEEKADWLLFLNDDVVIQDDPQWLTHLSRYLLLENVGIIGATLFYPDGTLQHNGIQIHPEWIARNITEWGKANELRPVRNVSAVTGACLLTKRVVWEQIGGFDECFAVSYNDVDFCLAARRIGWRIVQATDVHLIHHEHATNNNIDQPLWQKEKKFMQEKWQLELQDHFFTVHEVYAYRTRVLQVNS